MKLELAPEDILALVTGLGLLAEVTAQPSLVQHLTIFRSPMVDYFSRPDCMVLDQIKSLCDKVMAQVAP